MYDLPRAAAFTAQSVFHLDQRETVAEPGAQFHQREPRRVPALAAMRAVVVRIVDVREGCGFELGVHPVTVTPLGCGNPWDSSYSLGP